MSKELLQHAGGAVPELRIMLVGKTGVGKTSAMNVLMGKPDLTVTTAYSQTTECKTVETEFHGPRLVLIDTPGLNTKRGEAPVAKDVVGCIAAAAPGPHVFLLVMRADSKPDQDAVEIIHQMFGEESKKFTLALFTFGDKYVLKDEEVQKMILIPDKYIAGHSSFDNTGNTLPDQVPELLEKINKMVADNKGAHYTSQMLRKVQEVKEKQEMKGDSSEEHNRKTVEFLLSVFVGEPLASSMTRVVDCFTKKLEKLVK